MENEAFAPQEQMFQFPFSFQKPYFKNVSKCLYIKLWDIVSIIQDQTSAILAEAVYSSYRKCVQLTFTAIYR